MCVCVCVCVCVSSERELKCVRTQQRKRELNTKLQAWKCVEAEQKTKKHVFRDLKKTLDRKTRLKYALPTTDDDDNDNDNEK